ncbi:hypothetical protein ABE425_05505 [Chryseobacterium cucumeris]|uniref:hypothetical protein n=1 Tax=Chryseobacterium cucumeris TaxID=1813611 RepID=UPI0032092E46
MTAKEELKKLFADRNQVQVAIEINGFTGFRTTLIDDLTEEEAIKLLSVHAPSEKELAEENNALKEELIRIAWISKILKLAETTGIKEVGSFHKFNNWMYTKSIFKKHLNAHTIDELKQLHVQLHGVQSNNNESAKKPLTKAWWKKGKENINMN